MEKEKWYEKLKAQGQSITVPMTLLMIAVAVIPLFLQTWILIGSFKQNQIEARSIEIQNQCVILSNRMTDVLLRTLPCSVFDVFYTVSD